MNELTTELAEPSTYGEAIKLEEQQPNNNSQEGKEWDTDMELALLNAIARCKPVGIHKHFRIVSVQRQFNQHSPIHCTIQEIWQQLGQFYGMTALDELEEEDEEQEEEEQREEEKKRGTHEFQLPLDDYEQLISEHRQDDQQSISSELDNDVLPPSKRTRTSKRDSSPAASESVASTPEPEEGKPSNRRTSRGRKSEATPEPSTPRSQTMRRTGRLASRGTSSSNTTIKRQTKRK